MVHIKFHKCSSKITSNNISNSNVVRLIWHRHDLRLHDNTLYANLYDPNVTKRSDDENNNDNNNTTTTISLFIFDVINDHTPKPSICNPNNWDTINIGPFASSSLIEAVSDLRRSLRSIGGELLVRTCDGDGVTNVHTTTTTTPPPTTTKETIPSMIVKILNQINATALYFNEYPGVYEQQLSKEVITVVNQYLPKVNIVTDMQYTLYHPNDMPNSKTEWDALSGVTARKVKGTNSGRKKKINIKKQEKCRKKEKKWDIERYGTRQVDEGILSSTIPIPTSNIIKKLPSSSLFPTSLEEEQQQEQQQEQQEDKPKNSTNPDNNNNNNPHSSDKDRINIGSKR